MEFVRHDPDEVIPVYRAFYHRHKRQARLALCFGVGAVVCVPFAQRGEQEFDDMPRFADTRAPCILPLFEYEVRRIAPRRQLRHLHIHPRGERRCRRAPRGFDAGIVGIERKHHIFGKMHEERDVFVSEGGARDCDGIPPPRLMHGNEVHLPFDQYGKIQLADVLLGAVISIEQSGLAVERRLRTIEIFRRVSGRLALLCKYARGKSDDSACRIAQRKYDTTTESVVETFLGTLGETSGLYLFIRELLVPQVGGKGPPFGAHPAEPERRYGFFCKAALGEIRTCRVLWGEIAFKKSCRLFERFEHPVSGVALALPFVHNGYARFLGEYLKCALEIHALHLLHEREYIAANAASETMVCAPVRRNHE